MSYRTLLFAAFLLVTAGCSSSSDSSATSGDDAETGTLTPPATDTGDTLSRQLADELFVSSDLLPVGENASGGVMMGHWTVEFALDTVEWSHSDIVEAGTYTSDDTPSAGAATFAGRQIGFELDDRDLIWDSQTYLRAATELVDSQESLVAYLSNSSFNSVEEFDVGETATGEPASGNWSLQFDVDEVVWNVQDTAFIGTYAYTGKSRFQINVGDETMTAYLLDDNEIMFDSVIYRKEFSSQFDSQESLVSLFSGITYQSIEPQPVGETITGAQAFGFWYISFVSDTFTWDYQDVSEAGTYRYLDDDSFTAVLPTRDINVVVEGEDILFDGVRYRRN